MQTPNETSVTQWIADLRDGDRSVAEQQLWSRYFHRLMALANQKLGSTPRSVEDEEDVAVSALASFFVRARDGQFPDLADRDGLWPLLARITACKAVNLHKRQVAAKRGGGRRVYSADCGWEESNERLNELVDKEITPEVLMSLSEQCRLLMEDLPDQVLRDIAQLKMAGYSTAEISTQLQVAPRTIERKVSLIRSYWSIWLETHG